MKYAFKLSLKGARRRRTHLVGEAHLFQKQLFGLYARIRKASNIPNRTRNTLQPLFLRETKLFKSTSTDIEHFISDHNFAKI